MTLIDRAQMLLSKSTLDKLEHLLHDCVSAGTLDGLAAVQLLAEDMYDGITFNFELKCPAACCLVAWQERGLEGYCQVNAFRADPTPRYWQRRALKPHHLAARFELETST